MYCIVQTPTPNLKKSIDFYSKLGFTRLAAKAQPIFTDGRVSIEISSDRFARSGLKLYKSNWTKDLVELEKYCQVYHFEHYELISCPGSCWIYLISEENNTPEPKLLDNSLLGKFGGLSLETTETKRAFEILNVLGFKLSFGSVNTSWFTMQNENGFTLSIMAPNNCPHLFVNPSLSYFNGRENIRLIERIRNTGLEIMEEITVFNAEGIVDNISLRDPGGLGFFVFND